MLTLFTSTTFRRILFVASLLLSVASYSSDKFSNTLLVITGVWGYIWIIDGLKRQGYSFRDSWVWRHKKSISIFITLVLIALLSLRIAYKAHLDQVEEKWHAKLKLLHKRNSEIVRKYIAWRHKETERCIGKMHDKRKDDITNTHDKTTQISTNPYDTLVETMAIEEGPIRYLKRLPVSACTPPFNEKKFYEILDIVTHDSNT